MSESKSWLGYNNKQCCEWFKLVKGRIISWNINTIDKCNIKEICLAIRYRARELCFDCIVLGETGSYKTRRNCLNGFEEYSTSAVTGKWEYHKLDSKLMRLYYDNNK
jgi:hypothetical protein